MVKQRNKTPKMRSQIQKKSQSLRRREKNPTKNSRNRNFYHQPRNRFNGKHHRKHLLPSLLLILTNFVHPSSPKVHKLSYIDMGRLVSHAVNCASDTSIYLVPIQLAQASKHKTIRIKLKSTVQNGEDYHSQDEGFIHNDQVGAKFFGLFEPGDECYSYRDRLKEGRYPLFIIAMTKVADPADPSKYYCRIQKIITNNFLRKVDCDNNDKYKTIWEIIQLKDQLEEYDFQTIGVKTDYLSKYYKTGLHRIHEASIADIDEDMIKVVVYQPFRSVSTTKTIPLFSAFLYKRIRPNLSVNPDLKEMVPSEIIGRLTKNRLPGYLLGDTNKPAESKYIFQNLMESSNKEYVSLHFVLYMTDALSLVGDEKHFVTIEAKPYLTKDGRTEAKLLSISRKMEIKRYKYDKKQLSVTIYDGEKKVMRTTEFEMSEPGGYLYLSLAVGLGVLHHQRIGKQVAVTLFDTLTIHQVGGQTLVLDSNRQKSYNFEQIFESNLNEANERFIKIRQSSLPAGSLNKVDIRVLVAARGKGTYPSHLGTSFETNPIFDRCFVKGYASSHCLALAVVNNDPIGPQTQYMQDGHTVKILKSNNSLLKSVSTF